MFSQSPQKYMRPVTNVEHIRTNSLFHVSFQCSATTGNSFVTGIFSETGVVNKVSSIK